MVLKNFSEKNHHSASAGRKSNESLNRKSGVRSNHYSETSTFGDRIDNALTSFLKFVVRAFTYIKNPAKYKRYKSNFIISCVALGVILVLILGIVILASAHSNSDVVEFNRIQMFYSAKDNNTKVIFKGVSSEDVIKGKVESVLSSESGKIQAVRTTDGLLYCVNETKVEEIASNVVDFLISANGEKIAYIVETPEPANEDDEPDNDVSSTPESDEEPEYHAVGGDHFVEYTNTTLYVYYTVDISDETATETDTTVTESKETIALNAQADSLSFSPNGDVLGYVTSHVTEESKYFEGFFWSNGTSDSIGRNTLPIASSDDMSYQYYLKIAGAQDDWAIDLNMKVNDKIFSRLCEFGDLNYFVGYLNRDFSELIYSVSGKDGLFYLASEESKEPISKGFRSVLGFGEREISNGYLTILPTGTFKKYVFTNADGSVQYLDKKYTPVSVDAAASFIRISLDRKTVFYLDSANTLFSCNVRKNVKLEIASGVTNFDINPEGAVIYYVNNQQELHYVKGSRDDVKENNVYTTGKGMAVTDSGTVYFLKDFAHESGTLCYMKANGKTKVLENYNNVHDIAADSGDNIYYRADFGANSGNYSLWYGKAKKYKELLNFDNKKLGV